MNILKIKNSAFTLVELIVVITILSILGTIAFISLQGYSEDARDSARLTDISIMKSSLELFQIDSGKYPTPSNPFDITYSGAIAWKQGTFGESVFSNVTRLDKIPLDPITDKEYVYSVSGIGTEFQLASAFESDAFTLNNNDISYADLKTAKLKIMGSYNGKVLKINSGSLTYVLAIPSIISTTGATLQEIINNDNLAYNGYKNLPFQFNGIYNINGETNLNLVNKSNILLYSGDIKLLSEQSTSGKSTRFLFLQKMQEAYTGTNLVNVGEIAQVLNVNLADPIKTEYITSFVVKNDLGGDIKALTLNSTYANCISTSYSGYTIPNLVHGTINQSIEKPITNGTLSIPVTCNNGVLSYGDIETTTCSNNYILSGNNCVLDTCGGTMPDNAELNGTQGTATWAYNIIPGTCKYKCQDGYHTENGGTTCISNVGSCLITNGNGTQTWNGSTWGTCSVVTCNSNYTQNGNVCDANTQSSSCLGSIPSNASATTGTTYTQTWNGSIWAPTTSWGESQSTCDFNCNSNYAWNNATNTCDSTLGYIVGNDTTGRYWSDGSYATSCKSYKNPGSGKAYSGVTGNGVYMIDIDGASTGYSPFKVYCDMTTDGGGWTLFTNITGTTFTEDYLGSSTSQSFIFPFNETNSLKSLSSEIRYNCQRLTNVLDIKTTNTTLMSRPTYTGNGCTESYNWNPQPSFTTIGSNTVSVTLSGNGGSCCCRTSHKLNTYQIGIAWTQWTIADRYYNGPSNVNPSCAGSTGNVSFMRIWYR